MNISSICRRPLLLGAVLLLAGCAYSGGELLFVLGVGKPRMVPAEFRLTEAPVMIFIDDVNERLDWPAAKRDLFDELSQELLRRKGAAKIVPLETVEQLQQSVPDFDKRGCREIGEMAGAAQVLWLEVRDFLASEDIFDADNAAYFAVTVKVVNVLETQQRSRVRLWPASPEGHLVVARMAGSEVSIAKTRGQIAKELSQRLAADVARLFYDHRAPEFERPS
jgi:hypothetical protein